MIPSSLHYDEEDRIKSESTRGLIYVDTLTPPPHFHMAQPNGSVQTKRMYKEKDSSKKSANNAEEPVIHSSKKMWNKKREDPKKKTSIKKQVSHHIQI